MISFRLATLALVSLCLAPLAAATAHPAAHADDPVKAQYVAGPLPDRIVLSFVGDPATSQAVTWRTDASVGSTMAEIARADHGPDFADQRRPVEATTTPVETEFGIAHYHTARFEDLEPETMYAYRVGGGGGGGGGGDGGGRWSEWFQFKTASAEARPFSFIYLGDAQNDIRSRWSRVLREAHAEAPRAAFVIHAGDLVNTGDDEKDWGEWFHAGGWLNGMLPVVPVPGNHEYHLTHQGPEAVRDLAPTWAAQFALPDNGPPVAKGAAYYLDYQGVRIIALNSNEPIDEQAEWLKTLLEDDDAPQWTVLTMHHPVYSPAVGRQNGRLRDVLGPLLRGSKVDLVLQGHDHTYARGMAPADDAEDADDADDADDAAPPTENVAGGATFHQEGGPVFVVSVSGPKMYEIEAKPWMQRVAEGTQLYQVITVDGPVLRYEARTAMGTLYDSFTLDKSPRLTEQPVDLDERRRRDEPIAPPSPRPVD